MRSIARTQPFKLSRQKVAGKMPLAVSSKMPKMSKLDSFTSLTKSKLDKSGRLDKVTTLEGKVCTISQVELIANVNFLT